MVFRGWQRTQPTSVHLNSLSRVFRKDRNVGASWCWFSPVCISWWMKRTRKLQIRKEMIIKYYLTLRRVLSLSVFIRKHSPSYKIQARIRSNQTWFSAGRGDERHCVNLILYDNKSTVHEFLNKMLNFVDECEEIVLVLSRWCYKYEWLNWFKFFFLKELTGLTFLCLYFCGCCNMYQSNLNAKRDFLARF